MGVYKNLIEPFLMRQPQRALFLTDQGQQHARAGDAGHAYGNAATFSALIKTTVSGANQVILARYVSSGGTGNGFILYLSASGLLYLDGRDGTTSYRTCRAASMPLNDGEWHKVKGIINNNIWQIYADDVLLREIDTGYTNTQLNIGGSLQIGFLSGTGQFVGYIDDVSCSTSTGEVLRYNFNTLVNGLVPDLSGNGYSASLQSGATLADIS